MKKGLLSFIGLVLFVLIFSACSTVLEHLIVIPQSGGGGGAPVNRLQEGTYTFWPRLQAVKNGIPQAVYVHQVVVRGRNVLVYIGEASRGPSTSYYGVTGSWLSGALLTNLDNSSQSWSSTSVSRTGDHRIGSIVLSFENVSGTRFSMESGSGNDIVIFEEIQLTRPDAPLQTSQARAGTYTFWPRVQAIRSGMPQAVYIHQVVVRGRHTLVYIGESARGPSTSYYGITGAWLSGALITDLDNPSQSWSYVGIQRSDDNNLGSIILSFENISGTRFSLESGSGNDIVIFEEFILGDPDR